MNPLKADLTAGLRCNTTERGFEAFRSRRVVKELYHSRTDMQVWATSFFVPVSFFCRESF